jgi:cation diffusion facilitator family transporter
MHTHSIDDFRHSHVFLGDAHERNERKTWSLIAICAAMMVAEIVGGWWFGSVALIADGLHMSTHAGALLIAAMAYTYSRRYVNDPRLTFGTGKLGDLAAFTSAIALAMIALLIGYESVDRLVSPVPIAFNQAIPIAVIGLGVNLLSAFLLRDDHDHHHGVSGFSFTPTIIALPSALRPATKCMLVWSLSSWRYATASMFTSIWSPSVPVNRFQCALPAS